MMNFDYWIQQKVVPEIQSKPHLNVEAIDDLVPLDDQFGVEIRKTAPDALQNILFGQNGPTEANLTQVDGDLVEAPPLHTFAILDGARVTNLAEMLATSGLEHRCLFKGDASDDLKNVAPWIVKLEDGNNFTRNLFTRSDAPWHLWDAEPGIYFRSRGSLNDMWRHLRKFTKIQDEDGRWYFLAFWRSSVLEAFRHEICWKPVSDPFFAPFTSTHWFTSDDAGKRAFLTLQLRQE